MKIIDKIKSCAGYISTENLNPREYKQLIYQVKKWAIKRLKSGLYYLEDYEYDVTRDLNKITLPDYLIIKLYYKNKKMYELRKTEDVTDTGTKIMIYDRERCVML